MLNRFLAFSFISEGASYCSCKADSVEFFLFKDWTKYSEGVLEFKKSSHDSGVIISMRYGTPNVNVVEKRYKTFMRV